MPRTLLIQVKVDESEKARIAEVAERAGMAPSAFLRHLGLSEHRLQNKPDFDSPIPVEPPHESEMKAKVRQAVANEEPYEVLVEPGTIEPDVMREDEDSLDEETWTSRRASQLKARMSSRVARRQAEIEWEEMG